MNQTYQLFDSGGLNDDPYSNASSVSDLSQQMAVTSTTLQTDSFQNQNQNQPVPHPTHPTVFFYKPLNDIYHYHVNCRKIYNTVTDLLNNLLNNKEHSVQLSENEYMFFYQ